MNQQPIQKSVVISGAGSGIGRSTARTFHSHGWRVILTGRRQDKLLESTAGLVHFECIPCDLQNAADIDALKERLTDEPVAALINNAGIYERRSFEETTDEQWFKIFDTNLFGSVRLTRAFLSQLQTNHGCVINVSSTLGHRPVAMTSAYSASKAAMINWTQSLALELAPRVRVNCIAPGIVDTPIHKFHDSSSPEGEKTRQMMAALHPLKRMGHPEDIAQAAYYFATAPWVTGATLDVDGGIHL